MSNAVKFTDRRGQIKILVEQQQVLQNGEFKKYLKISVTDNGRGIKKKNQDKLFKLFGSIKNEKKKINTQGIGLGLVICKLLVNKFDGVIDFVSKFKVETTFFFTMCLESEQRIVQKVET